LKTLSKQQILLIAAGIVVTIVLFSLPKGVVKKEASNSGKAEVAVKAAEGKSVKLEGDLNADTLHKAELPAKAKQEIVKLKALAVSGNTESKVKALVQLAALFKENMKYDSASVYLEQRALILNTSKALEEAGETYYEAYSLAFDEGKRSQLLAKSQELLKMAFEKDKSLTAKAKLAMTYVESPNPMQGIALLREVLEADPKNELALYNLGTLSIRSQQFDKALGRFQQLVEINPRDSRYHFYLAECLVALKRSPEAITAYKKALQLNTDPTAKATIEDRLKAIEGK